MAFKTLAQNAGKIGEVNITPDLFSKLLRKAEKIEMGASQKLRFILVSRKTRLQELTERFNTWPQAKFYLEHNHADVADYLREHDVYMQQLLEAERILKGQGRFQLLERSFLPDYRFTPDDVVSGSWAGWPRRQYRQVSAGSACHRCESGSAAMGGPPSAIRAARTG